MIDRKFRLYQGDGDDEVFERPDGSKEKNTFVFTGFGNGIHPYHRKELNWIKEMLEDGGVILNIHEVPTVNDMGDDADSGEFTIESLHIPNNGKSSQGGDIYWLIQDVEMGRGWAILLCNKSIITQDHRDNVRDELLEGDFIRSFDVDYQKVKQ